ncbi:hypothetical protein [Streptomyces sp. NBC_01431]|uniref:hypothetical protein n=1 Tax=Streptomyces sp. NBC_01431 TaxID=2903863 RepID=UPI002E3637DE|nr:hypothetical protein [Streptomyces sp. NBC_01431]
MAQYDDSTREVYDAISEAMAESIRLFVTLAALAAEMAIEAREERMRLAREADEERARAALERLQAERAAAEPLLRAAHQERFWRDPDAQRIARSWQAAAEWAAHGDPYAAMTLEHMRDQLKERFGIEVPQWQVEGQDLTRLLALSDPAFQRALEQAQEAATALPGLSYAVLIRDVDNPYEVAFRGEVSAPLGREARAVAAQEYQAWAAGAGAEVIQDRSARFVTELVENTGDPQAAHVPAATVYGDQAAALLEDEAAQLRGIIDGNRSDASVAERFYALSVESERLREEEWRRIARREDYLKRLDAGGLSAADEKRLEGNVAAVSEGLGTLRQAQADTALEMAATAAEIRGENPSRVVEAARLTDTLDDGWWATASGEEIAGVWGHVQEWEAGQAREDMQRELIGRVERQHGVVLSPSATPEMVAGLFGGPGRTGQAVALSAEGEVLRSEAQTAFAQSFDAFTRATRLETEAERQSGAYADELRVEAARLVDQAVKVGERGTRLLDQGTWLDAQAASTVARIYSDNSGAAAEQLAEEFAKRWGRPLSEEANGQLAEAVQQMYRNPLAPAVEDARNGPEAAEAGTDPASLAAIPGQVLRGVEEAVEGVADGREDERRAEAAQAVSGLGDDEVAEAVRLGALGYPRGAEAATERAPAQSRGPAPEGREHGREIERQGL